MNQQSVHIRPGASMDEVVAVMGPPQNRQFNGPQEAWQYCSTGWSSDSYTVFWFENSVVAGMTTYTQRFPGSCQSYFRQVEWESSPDAAIEIRDR